MLASFRKAIIALALIFPSAALAQGTILQGGPFTSGHPLMYVGQGGSQAVAQDAGPAGGGAVGYGLSELAVTARGTGTGPYAGLGTGPLGTINCTYDNAPGTASYHYLCLSANAQGGGLMAYGAVGASALPLSFIVNGTTYPFPFVTGGIVGPGTTVVNDVACWNNLVGTLLKDCGPAISTSTNNTWTGTNNFTGPFQISGAAQTFPPSGLIVGTSDAQTLTNKSIAASQINSGTLPAVVMPAFTGDVTSSAGSVATTISAGVVTNAKLAVATQNTIKGAATSTAVADLAMPSCSGSGNALQWVTNTGIQCGTLSGQTAGWGLTGTSVFSISTSQPPYGFDVPINLGITVSAGASALTIAVVGANGSNGSASNPISAPFHSRTNIATGTPEWLAITSAMSITIPSGATLGTTNSVPFRIWIFLQDVAGSPQLNVATCSTQVQIYPCASWESSYPTSTTITGLSTASGTLYAPTGGIGPARIIGYCDFASGLATAGAWTSGCTTLQLFGPGIKKPGDVVQVVAPGFGTLTAVTFTTTVTSTNVTAAITPTTSPNLVRYTASFTLGNSIAADTQVAQMYRGSTPIGVLGRMNNGAASGVTLTLVGYDAPGTSGSATYVIKGGAASGTAGTGSIPQINTDSAIEILEEIMGALDLPANDNGLWQPRMAG